MTGLFTMILDINHNYDNHLKIKSPLLIHSSQQTFSSKNRVKFSSLMIISKESLECSKSTPVSHDA